MPPSRKPGPGQMAFGEIAESSRPVVDLNRRNAFGRVTNPDYLGVDLATLAEVTPEDLKVVEIDFIRSNLFTESAKSVNGVVLNEGEYTAIVRYPRAFSTQVAAKTLLARQIDSNIDRRDEYKTRSVEHAFESKIVVMRAMLSGLREEEAWLKLFQREMRSPGYAHMNEAQMRMLVESTRQISFANMLSVTRVEQGWDAETFHRAERALNTRLVIGKQNEKVGYWRDLTQLAIDYNHAKQAISRHRLAKIGSS